MNVHDFEIEYHSKIFTFNYNLFYSSSPLFQEKYPIFNKKILINGNFSYISFKIFLEYLENRILNIEDIFLILEILNYWNCFEFLDFLKQKFLSFEKNSFAFYNLGIMYLKGYGVEKNFNEAKKYFFFHQN